MIRRLRFWLFSLLGLLTALLTYLFTPGQWLHRAVALALCGVLTADQVCLPQEPPAINPGTAVAAVPTAASEIDPQLATAWENWLADRTNEFDDDSTPPATPGNVTPPPFPEQPGPNQPLRSPDFNDGTNSAGGPPNNSNKRPFPNNSNDTNGSAGGPPSNSNLQHPLDKCGRNRCDFSTLGTSREAQRCFGASGSQCEGGDPLDIVHGVHKDYYTCTAHMFVSDGSIAHDNCCIQHPDGYACGGFGNPNNTETPGTNVCKNAWDQAVADSVLHRGNLQEFGSYINPNYGTECNKREGEKKTGTSYGDPHIITFDGFRYSFQTVGEFTLVQATDGSFEVQTRQSAVPGRDLSLNTGVAIRAGSDRIAVYSKFFPDSDTNNPLRVNGRPVTIQGGSLTLPGGAVIYQQGQHDYLVEVPTGEQVAIKSIRMGASEYMNVTPAVFSGSPGLYTGLLGDMDGNPGNDLRGRDGNVIPSRSTYGDIKNIATRIIPIPGVIPLGTIENAVFDQLYKQFGNSWRISAANSLFDYAPGQSTETFTDRSFPRQYRTLNQLSPQQIEQAERTCLEAGVEPDLLEGCIFDVGFTGEAGFAQSAANAMNLINQFNRIIPGGGVPIPRPPVRIPGLPF